MLKEEFRSHASYSGQERFLTFPIFVFFIASVIALTLEKTLETVSLKQLTEFSHLSAFIYGLSVGAFGLMGRQYLERRYGRSTYLVAMPYLLPLSFKTTFLGIYLRDALFYVLLMLVPATAGLMFAAPMVGFSFVSIGLFFFSILLTFLIGLSMSFLASVMFIRDIRWFGLFTAAVVALFVMHGALGLIPLEAIMPSLGLQLNVRPFQLDMAVAAMFAAVSVTEICVMAVVAYALVEVRISISSQSYADTLPRYYAKLRWLSGLPRALFAKEFVDLRRSGTIAKMSFAFVLPLLFLSFTAWFVNYGLAIPVGFNTVFYAAMVGFVGVLMYSWLNNIDLAEYYSLIPVTVPQLIKTRVAVFLVLTLGISASFVIGIAILNAETRYLWLALLVMFVTSLYMVLVLAYLTGLRTNTFLFDTGILAKFTIMSFLPDVCLAILSFSLSTEWAFAVMGLALVLSSMFITSLILYRGIESKWGKTSFTE
jgi:hypothetical protein